MTRASTTSKSVVAGFQRNRGGVPLEREVARLALPGVGEDAAARRRLDRPFLRRARDVDRRARELRVEVVRRRGLDGPREDVREAVPERATLEERGDAGPLEAQRRAVRALLGLARRAQLAVFLRRVARAEELERAVARRRAGRRVRGGVDEEDGVARRGSASRGILRKAGNGEERNQQDGKARRERKGGPRRSGRARLVRNGMGAAFHGRSPFARILPRSPRKISSQTATSPLTIPPCVIFLDFSSPEA